MTAAMITPSKTIEPGDRGPDADVDHAPGRADEPAPACAGCDEPDLDDRDRSRLDSALRGRLSASRTKRRLEAIHDVHWFSGISVFAETAELGWIDHAAQRFAAVEWLVLFTAGDLQASGVELWDTGLAPHCDVVHPDRRELVARMRHR